MNAPLISFPTQTHHNHQTFEQRATKVDQLIDAKCKLVMESARLQSLAHSQPQQQDRCLAQIETLSQHIETLQAQIDQELQGLLQTLKPGSVPTP